MNSPLFSICLTLAVYTLCVKLQQKLKSPLLNPLLISSITIIFILVLFKIPYESFKVGGDFVTLLIAPATVSLAIPLYKHKAQLLKHKKVIIISIITGVITHAISIGALSLLLNLDSNIIASLVPKSVTTAIAQDISANIGGIPIITICVVIVTGILGSALSPILVKLFKLDSDISIGLALGTSAHAVGTSKAIETNDIQGTMASLALIFTGILTVIMAPLTFKLIELLMK